MKKLVFILLLLASTAYGAINAGFVQGLWYSSYPFFDGDEVRIYTAVHNQSEYDISGKVNFFIDNSLIDSKDFSTMSGNLTQSWTDWDVKEGRHIISVNLSDVMMEKIGSSPEAVELPGISVEEIHNIDKDTDDDGIGNKRDTDDDNDGVTDIIEKIRGTDPLVSGGRILQNQTTKTADNVKDKIRDAVVSSVVSVNKFADSKKEQLEKIREEIIKEREEIGVNKPKTTTEKIMPSAYQVLLSAAITAIEYKPIMYTIFILAVILIIRFIIKRR